jgi:uncharacterized protein DUF6194
MKLQKIIEKLCSKYSDISMKKSWGETALFYNPNNVLPNGKYFVTFKEKDGKNDCSSKLDRDTVKYRLNLKISKKTFLEIFNEEQLPGRPAKSHIISLHSGNDFNPMKVNKIMPHPVYGWMSWACVINPSEETFHGMIKTGLFDESYDNARKLFNKQK